MMKKMARLTFLLIFLMTVSGPSPAAGQEIPKADPHPFAVWVGNALFLPIAINGFAPHNVSGQLTDETGQPLGGVLISNGSGDVTTSDADGNYSMIVNENQGAYSFAPLETKMGFIPTAMDLIVTGNVANLDFTGMSSCGEMIANGGFEVDDWWELQDAAFTTLLFNSGARSLALGQIDPGDNASGVSTATSSILAIPTEAKDPLLRLWIYTKSISPASYAPSIASHADTFFGPNSDSNDLQALQILDANGQILETLWEYNGANNQEWGLVQYNLYRYAGQNIRLRMLVQNDGAGQATSMFVDDMTLSTCPIIPAPEIYNPTGAPEEALAACTNQLINPGFENNTGWGIPHTAYSASYRSKAPYPDEVFAGNRSMRTGIPAYLSWQDRYSYSDFWQTVYIPTNAVSAELVFRNKMVNPLTPSASEADLEANLEKEPQFAAGVIWGEQALANDWMYVLILNPNTGAIIQTLGAWTARNTGWKLRTFDLMAYRGRNIRIQFGTFNNGGWDSSVQSMYVDEAYVNVCTTAVPPPPPPSLSCPAGYTQRLANNSFEASHAWYIPVTAYSAHYSYLTSKTGVRSMQTGIINPYHNRFSYSDFGQLTVVPGGAASAILKFWAFRQSNDSTGADKQYLLVLNPWGQWIDTLLWNHSNNSAAWMEIVRDISSKPYNGWPIRLQFGTFNNGWGGVTAMFIDDVTLCTK